ncbi:hypothetical protein XENORESO_016977 [Xenotaenia resolanae]|uniref:Uncharacterized protein n=1 Tax=Xenotaenia resolanae TaxID=208358 RepID=A0ABV0VM83_9TELE
MVQHEAEAVVKATPELCAARVLLVCGCECACVRMPRVCVCVHVCSLMSVGSSSGGAAGLQHRHQDEHLRLSWHQVLLSCLNESNLLSPLLPSLTKQISFAACSSLLIQLPQAPLWLHQLWAPSFIRAAHCHPLIGIKYHRF